MPRAALVLLAIVAGLPVVGGCRLVEPGASGRSPLAPAQASAGSVALEIFFARFPYGQPALARQLWDEIDEQALPAETRQQLAQNGLRAGVVDAHVPVALARLLTLSDAPQKSRGESIVDLETEPTVTLRRLAVRSGRRSEVITSPAYERLPLLMRESGGVAGRTFPNADCRFALRATAQPGKVGLELLPELQYGEAQQRWTAADGIIRLDAARPKKILENLRIKTELAPGQMLVLSCQADRSGSLGHYYFTEATAEALVQKILIIRLAQAGSDQSFADSVSAQAPDPVEEPAE